MQKSKSAAQLATEIVAKDVRIPKCIRDGIVKSKTMETSKIPTAEEFLLKHPTISKSDIRNEDDLYLYNAMTEFARLHVKAALEAAAEKAETERGYLNNLPVIYVTKKSILNAYPLDNIK